MALWYTDTTMEVLSLELYFVIQIVVAIFLGAILGIQRERSGKSAGPRTYGLVTAGSCLVTILALHVFESPAIIGQILTGIGFLGAGLIFHKGVHVDGLTTAAGLWMSATIGMVVGARLYVTAAIVTILILALLSVSDRKFKGKKDSD